MIELTTIHIQKLYTLMWGENPKLHDLDRIEASILRHGFKNPPKLDGLLGVVEGHGRILALHRMWSRGDNPPSGVEEWMVPVITGNDSETVWEGMAYAVDHNNTTLADLVEPRELWDDRYDAVLELLSTHDNLPVTAFSGDEGVIVRVKHTDDSGADLFDIVAHNGWVRC